LSHRWAIWGILALAAAVRLVNLGGRRLWYDEAFAVLYAEKPLDTMLYGTLTRVDGVAADVHPLFYYSVLHTWMKAFGQSPAAVRALSVLLGVATVGLVYLFGRELFGRRTGLVVALVTALAPFAVYYSQETRMYALLGCAAVAAAFFFVRAWARGGWYWWLAFGVCGALTLYAHNLGFACLVGLDAWVVWLWLRHGEERWRHALPLLLSHLLILALFAPWLLVVPGQFGKIAQAYWVQQPGLAELVQTLLVFHFAYDNQALPGWLAAPALFFGLLVVVLVALQVGRAQQTSRLTSEVQAPYALLLSLSLVPVLIVFGISQLRPVYVIRALLPAALAYYVLLAAGFVRGTLPRPVKWGVAVPAALIVGASLWNHYAYAQFPRPPFDNAAAFLRAHAEPGDVIVHSNKLTFFPTHYYDRTLPQSFIADAPGSPSDTLAYPTQVALGLFATPDLAIATRGHDRVWFVLLRRAVDEYRAAGQADHPQRIWLEQHFHLVSVTAFNDLDVYEYRAGPSPIALGHAGAQP
jgi:4-amino-4-deoxy-L-arabinose transferase-like glycosyltransferase